MDDNKKAFSALPQAVQEAVDREIKSGERMHELGFTPSSLGEWRAENCTVTVYSSCGEWEIDIKLPNGSAVGCDTPTFGGRTADEIAAAREEIDREQAQRPHK